MNCVIFSKTVKYNFSLTLFSDFFIFSNHLMRVIIITTWLLPIKIKKHGLNSSTHDKQNYLLVSIYLLWFSVLLLLRLIFFLISLNVGDSFIHTDNVIKRCYLCQRNYMDADRCIWINSRWIINTFSAGWYHIKDYCLLKTFIFTRNSSWDEEILHIIFFSVDSVEKYECCWYNFGMWQHCSDQAI